MKILVTFALEPELVEQIRAVAPDRIQIDVLGQDQRRLLRGFKYPSEREREAVAEGLHGAFEHAEVVFGFWGTELHYALIDARAVGGNVPAKLGDVAPLLKWIQLTSAGADRLLNSGFIEGGVTVTTVSGLHATPIGEFVLSAILMFAKGAPQTMRAQLKHEWARFAPRELSGKTVGIVGLGHIGAEVGRLAKAFGCRVIATKRSTTEPHRGLYTDLILPAADLHQLLAESDFVVLSMPLTPETRGMIGANEIASMPRGAIVINAARGEVLDVDAALAALARNGLGGLALDVYDPEPPARTWPDDPRLILTPHIAGCTTEAKSAIGAKLYEKICAYYATRRL